MYERSYGYRYGEIGDRASNAEIAKVMRRDIKQAQEEGLLPRRWSYSVRSDHLSIDVEVRDCPDAWQVCDGTVPGSKHEHPGGGWTAQPCGNVWCSARNDPAYAHAAAPHDTLTEDARAARMTLDRIHGAFNHDGSEIQVDYFDVRYYGHVSFEDASSADFRRREAERMAAKKAARESGKMVGFYVNYSREGRQTIHAAIETPEGKVVLACGARTYRSGLGGLSKRDHEITCSRCAKRAKLNDSVAAL
jgi:hypothetical protein